MNKQNTKREYNKKNDNDSELQHGSEQRSNKQILDREFGYITNLYDATVLLQALHRNRYFNLRLLCRPGEERATRAGCTA